MAILVLILVALLGVFALFLSKYRWGSIGLLVLGVMNVLWLNIYNINDYAIKIGNFVFGLDGITYIIFVACVVLFALENKPQHAKTLCIIGLIAIVLNDLMLLSGLVAKGEFAEGWATPVIINIFSAISVFVVVYSLVLLIKVLKAKKWNSYLIMLVGVILAVIVDSLFYFGFNVLCGTLQENFLDVFLASIITKGVTLVLVLIGMFINSLLPKKAIVKLGQEDSDKTEELENNENKEEK